MPWLHRVRFLGMGVLGSCPQHAGRVLVSCWTSWGQQGSKFGLPFEYRGVGYHLTLCDTICILMEKEKERMQGCNYCDK